MALPVIPDDWEMVTVGSIAQKKPNSIVGGPFGSDLVSTDYVPAGVPVIRGQNMGQAFVSGDFVFVSDEKAKALSSNLAAPGDVVFTQRGTLGQVSVVPDSPFDRYLISQSQMKLSVDPQRFDVAFLCQYFSSAAGQQQILESAIQTGVPHTNLTILRGYYLPRPPLHEQQAIAAALTAADGVVAGLERVIAKKRLIKQGAMQDLLTARRRLPGFSGEWEEATLSELADIRSGGTPSTSDASLWDGDIPWVTPTDITALDGRKFLLSTSRTISRAGLRQSSAELLPEGTIVMTSRATIGECAIATIPLTTNQGFKNFIPKDRADRDFLYYLLMSLKKGFIELCSGSTFLEIGKTQLTGYTVRVPETKKEQEAIAAVLSDMDAEIQTLETRLAKSRAMKEGMMQNLLTGRVRLV